MHKALSVLILLWTSYQVLSSRVLLECLTHRCSVTTNNNINVEEGSDIILKFTITNHDNIFALYYTRGAERKDMLMYYQDNSIRLYDVCWNGKDCIDYDLIDRNKSTTHSSLEVRVKKQSQLKSGDRFHYSFYGYPTYVINLMFGPQFSGELESVYSVEEHKDLGFEISINGNPLPTMVNASLHDLVLTNIMPSSSSLYRIKFEGIDHRYCGRNVTIKAESLTDTRHKTTYFYTKVNVTFIPSPPVVTSAVVYLPNCLEVEWEAVEAGSCEASYLLVYLENKIEQWRKITTSTKIEHCNGFTRKSNESLVQVKAIVGNKAGVFSKSTVATIRRRNTSESNLVTWVVVGAVGFVLLILVTSLFGLYLPSHINLKHYLSYIRQSWLEKGY